MIDQSRIYSFLDPSQRFNIQFLEGQKIIHDLSLLQSLNQSTLSFLRNSVLSLLPLSMFQKHMETLGMYIDSEAPFFRFKLEMSFQGTFRTLLIPQAIEHIPPHLTGHARIIKTQGTGEPYTSILEITKQTPRQIIDHVMKQTYQIDAKLLLSDSVDQSALIVKLPSENIDSSFDDSKSLDQYIHDQEFFLNKLINYNFQTFEEIHDLFQHNKFSFLHGKDTKFFCPCSQEQMIHNLKKLPPDDIQHIFLEQNPIHLTCDYCRKEYNISKSELNTQKEQ